MRKSKRFLAMGVAFAMSIASVTGMMAATAQAVAPPGTASPSPPAICRSSSNRSRSPSITPADALLTPIPEPAVRTPSDGGSDVLRGAGRAGRGPDSGPAHVLRPAHRRRLVQQPDRRDGTTSPASDQVVPAADHAVLPARRRRSLPPCRSARWDRPATSRRPGNVVDSQPRVISNLIVDQTSTNPAAIAAAGFPVRSQGNPGLLPLHHRPRPHQPTRPMDGVPAGCVPSHQTLFIPNVTTDVGLSPPYNSLVHLLRPVLRPRR